MAALVHGGRLHRPVQRQRLMADPDRLADIKARWSNKPAALEVSKAWALVDVRWLVGEVEQLRGELDRAAKEKALLQAVIRQLRGLLAHLEWAGQPVPGERIGTHPRCPVCRVTALPHDRGCWLEAELHPSNDEAPPNP